MVSVSAKTVTKKISGLCTFKVPVVYMAQDLMFLMGENHFEGDWKGWAVKIKTFLGPEMATSEGSAMWAQKSRDFHGPPLPMARVMDLPPSKSLSPCAI
jgi:hypothetical protein